MGKKLIKAYQITIKDFEIALRTTPWYRIGRLLSLQNDLNYFRDKLKEALDYEEENGSK
jgi:hypothetical protein